MHFVYDDGGREAAGFKGKTGDCVCRAIAIATGMPYKQVYDLINDHSSDERITKGKRKKSNARTGVYKQTYQKVLEHLGWQWVPTVFIGKGCMVHLCKDELPEGRIIVRLSRHTCAVVDGVIHDTYDPSRSGSRCVYGYYIKND